MKIALPVLLIILVGTLFTFGSCSGQSASSIAPQAATVMELKQMDKDEFVASAPQSSTRNTDTIPVQQRKRVIQGTLDLQVADFSFTLKTLSDRTIALGGYVASTNSSTSSANIILRIPSDKYDQLFTQASGMGKMLHSGSQVSDVTQSYYDLENRIRNKRILLERYLTYLRQAKSVEDLMIIERQVSDTTVEIEQLTGSFRQLENQIDYSTLTVDLRLPGSPDREGFDIGAAFSDFASNASGFFQWLIIALLYLIVMGIPITGALALLYFLCFGRVGIIRRLFRLLSSQKHPKKDT